MTTESLRVDTTTSTNAFWGTIVNLFASSMGFLQSIGWEKIFYAAIAVAGLYVSWYYSHARYLIELRTLQREEEAHALLKQKMQAKDEA